MSNTTTANCIYCAEPFDPTVGQGDHVLPCRLFGEFESDLRFRGMCPRCNNAIGRCEQQLSQASPLGFYRAMANPNLGRRTYRGSLKQGPAMGAPSPRYWTEFEKFPVVAKPNGVSPMALTTDDQVVILDKSGDFHHIMINNRMTVESFKRVLESRSITDADQILLLSSVEDSGFFKTCLDAAFPYAAIHAEHEISAGTSVRAAHARFTVNEAYYRAIAKIAFHYYLTRNHRGYVGHESFFEPIRRFIQEGGDPSQFFHSSGRTFGNPFGEMQTGGLVASLNWLHILAADESKAEIVVSLQFFIGPESVPPATYVTLAKSNARIILPDAVWGHVYTYDEKPKGKSAGRVLDAEVTRLR